MTEDKAGDPIDPMEQARRIMKRLSETPHEPHKPINKRTNKDAESMVEPKERPVSKGRVQRGGSPGDSR